PDFIEFGKNFLKHPSAAGQLILAHLDAGAQMSRAAIAVLPEDVIRGISCLVPEFESSSHDIEGPGPANDASAVAGQAGGKADSVRNWLCTCKT
ncbi:hypothetical protein ACJEKK_25420, partial [Escherichia coli]